MNVNLQHHVDGLWNTSNNKYGEYKIVIKSQKGKGIKAHVFFGDIYRPIFTLRFKFITPEKLLVKVKNRIDKVIEEKKKDG